MSTPAPARWRVAWLLVVPFAAIAISAGRIAAADGPPRNDAGPSEVQDPDRFADGDRAAGPGESEEKRSSPSLPGELREPPQWLKNVPFDLAGYFAAVPEEENAAGLYLDALYEFSPDVMKKCVSPVEHEKRGPALEARRRRTEALFQRWNSANPDVTRAERARAVEEYRDSFNKLALAQTRKRCVFQTGIELMDATGEPLASPRQVVKLLEWRVEARVAEGRIDAALDDVEMALRLSRDLRPRGPIIRQLVSLTLESQAFDKLIPGVLGAARLQSPDCDRLLKIIARHTSEGVDCLAEGFRGEYLVTRALLHRLETNQKSRAELHLTEALAPLTAADFAAEVDALNRYFLPLIHRGKRAIRDLAQTLPEQQRALDEMKVFSALSAALSSAAEGEPKSTAADYFASNLLIVNPIRRNLTRVAGAQCLAAVRRWQLTHRGDLPSDLVTACHAAGMAAVPIDEYSPSAEPLRFAVRDGEFIVYSIGIDGKDDRGEVEWKLGQNGDKGDWAFRLRQK